LPLVSNERPKHLGTRGIAEFDQRLDGRGDDLAALVGEELGDEANAGPLPDLGNKIRQLRERRVFVGQAA
jgi:hypothetical protein